MAKVCIKKDGMSNEMTVQNGREEEGEVLNYPAGDYYSNILQTHWYFSSLYLTALFRVITCNGSGCCELYNSVTVFHHLSVCLCLCL